MDEKMRILNMLAEGKITADQAAALLEAMDEEKTEALEPAMSTAEYDKKLVHISVDSSDGDRIRVRFPVKAVKKILRATGKLPINVNGMDNFDMEDIVDSVIECLDNNTVGDFVNVDSAEGDHIRVYVE